jgi:hypothetical protein
MALLSRAELALVGAHFRKYPLKACPICEVMGWDVVGLEAALPWQTQDPSRPEGDIVFPPPGVTATVLVVCRTCGYVQRFAWNAIRYSGGHAR